MAAGALLQQCQFGIAAAQAARNRPQWASRAVHVSSQSDFRRVTANRTDQAAAEDPGEWLSHRLILADIETLPVHSSEGTNGRPDRGVGQRSTSLYRP